MTNKLLDIKYTEHFNTQVTYMEFEYTCTQTSKHVQLINTLLFICFTTLSTDYVYTCTLMHVPTKSSSFYRDALNLRNPDSFSRGKEHFE